MSGVLTLTLTLSRQGRGDQMELRFIPMTTLPKGPNNNRKTLRRQRRPVDVSVVISHHLSHTTQSLCGRIFYKMEAGLIKQFEQYARKNNIPEVLHILTDPALADFNHPDAKIGAAKRFEVVGGRDIYVMLQIAETIAHDDANFEAHRDYIDIHVPLEGAETIGYTPLDDRLSPGGGRPEYDASLSDDVTFSRFDSPDKMSTVRLVEGMYAIFDPDDVHMPRLQTDGPSYLRKLVVKVPVSLVARPEDQTTSPPSGTTLSELLV